MCIRLALAVTLAMVWASPARSAIVVFNSPDHASIAEYRTNWLAAAGISTPAYLVDFETGFTDLQNISGVGGLLPAGLVITDTSTAGLARIYERPRTIGGSNPVGDFALTQNERPYLVLDFSANPIDYLAFLDIDHTGTTAVVEFVGGATTSFSFEGTGVSGNTAEFVGVFKNDMPKIAKVSFDSSGDGLWGLDNIEFGPKVVAPPPPGVPEPGTLAFVCAAGIVASLIRRRR